MNNLVKITNKYLDVNGNPINFLSQTTGYMKETETIINNSKEKRTTYNLLTDYMGCKNSKSKSLGKRPNKQTKQKQSKGHRNGKRFE